MMRVHQNQNKKQETADRILQFLIIRAELESQNRKEELSLKAK